MRSGRFRIPPNLLLSAVIYGTVAGIVLGLTDAPNWAAYLGSLPYWPIFIYQLISMERDEPSPDQSARRRRSRRPLS